MELAGTSGIEGGNELATNSKNKNVRDMSEGINELKKGYQPRTNLVKDENDNICTSAHH
jgi:hypothetical protein